MTTIFGTGTRQVELYDDAEHARCFHLCASHLAHEQPDLVISGMAEGWDSMVADIATQLGIPWDAYLPNRGYGKYYWRDHSVTGENRFGEFQALLDNAREIHYTSDIYETQSLYVNGVHMNFLRNHHMVDNSDVGMAWDVASRGTSECIAYAKQVGVPVVVIG